MKTIPQLLSDGRFKSLGAHSDSPFVEVFRDILAMYSLQTQIPTWATTIEKDTERLKNISHNQMIESLTSKFNFKLLRHDFRNKRSENYFLCNDTTVLSILAYSETKKLNYHLSSLTYDDFKAVHELINSWFSEKTQKGRIFFLEVELDFLDFQDIGTVGSPLIEKNYSDEVLESFGYIKEFLPSQDAKGRLVILNGPPGGGKSFFIRGLAQDIDNCIFVMLFPHQLSQLTHPSTVPALLKLRNVYKGKSIVFVIEDGDTLLVPRENGSMNEIAQLLNLSDGLLGNLLDLKFIVSTNANQLEIDPAVRRTGRLLRHVMFNPLSYGQSRGILEGLLLASEPGEVPNPDKLLGDDLTKTFMLTDIYGLANKSDTKYTAKVKKSLGFK